MVSQSSCSLIFLVLYRQVKISTDKAKSFVLNSQKTEFIFHLLLLPKALHEINTLLNVQVDFLFYFVEFYIFKNAENTFFSCSRDDVATKNICSLKHFPYHFSQTHTDSLCYLLWITAPQDSSCWEGAWEVSAPTSCSPQVGPEIRLGCSGLHPVEPWKPLGMKLVPAPKHLWLSHKGETEAEEEPSHRKGQDHTEGWWWSQELRPDLWYSSQEKPTNCFTNTASMQLPSSPEAMQLCSPSL